MYFLSCILVEYPKTNTTGEKTRLYMHKYKYCLDSKYTNNFNNKI